MNNGFQRFPGKENGEVFRISKSRNRNVNSGWGERRKGTADGHRVSFGDDENVLKLGRWLYNYLNMTETTELCAL